jgi:putative phosphoesterase
MKLFIASDIHGSLSAAELTIEQFERSGADWLILLGDLLYHGPRNPLPDTYNPSRVAECLDKYASRIIAVRGNCDSEVDQMMLSFPIMAGWQQIIDGKRRYFLTHGHEYGPENLPRLNADDVLIYGHTHLPRAERLGGIYYFNPGSVSLPKGGYPASFGILSDNQLQVFSLKNNVAIVQVDI